MPTKKPSELPTLPFATPPAFARWLAKNHATSPGLWLKIAKIASGIASIRYAEALEAAVLGLDRRSEPAGRRVLVRSKVYPARRPKPLVQDQLREGCRTHRGRQDEARWAR